MLRLVLKKFHVEKTILKLETLRLSWKISHEAENSSTHCFRTLINTFQFIKESFQLHTNMGETSQRKRSPDYQSFQPGLTGQTPCISLVMPESEITDFSQNQTKIDNI